MDAIGFLRDMGEVNVIAFAKDMFRIIRLGRFRMWLWLVWRVYRLPKERRREFVYYLLAVMKTAEGEGVPYAKDVVA